MPPASCGTRRHAWKENGERGEAGRLATFGAPLHSGRSCGVVEYGDYGAKTRERAREEGPSGAFDDQLR
jgi:hypothetical protein